VAHQQEDPDREVNDEEVLDALKSELEEDDVHDVPVLTQADIHLGCFSLHKASHHPCCSSQTHMHSHLSYFQITNLSKKVANSPTIHHELAKLCVESNLTEQVLLHSVPKRWNLVTEMLGHAITLQPLLFSLCDMAQFNK